jgi:predicted RNA-binding Zn-ribbon protein involved in translation (DUF1610 family)
VICPGCGYKFIVGAVEVVPCPNCGEAVTVSTDEGEEE